jgi:cytoskeletal protein RodZ
VQRPSEKGEERATVDELAEVPEASAGAMSLAADECLDDRPPAPAEDQSDTRTFAPARAIEQPPALPGAHLREQREARGLTLDDVSRTTKINKTTLIALEATDLRHLPAGIYTRGFVKAYAREVGLDPDSAADEYSSTIEPPGTRPPSPADAVAASSTRHAGDGRHANADARLLLANSHSQRVTALLGIAAAIALAAYVFLSGPRDEGPAPPAEAAESPISDATAAGGGAAADAAPAVAEAALTDAPLRIELVSTRTCWLSASVDGERVLNKLLKPGERHTLDISDEVVMRIGDAGALAFSINGQTGRALGRSGQPVRVRITKNNFQTFLSS